ncbi:MAG: hypothetical protein RL375_4085 [Pseudomonadota bacterium]
MDTPELTALPPTPPGRYRHYKGGDYEVIGAARHSESLDALVVYRALYDDSGLWVRPHAMFFGLVEVDGVLQRRFAPLDGDDGPSASHTAQALVPPP